MKNININSHIKLWMMVLLCSATIFSCTQWDDYKKYTKDGAISYPGKLAEVKIFSGKERVRVSGRLRADPKIAKCKIFWNNKADSAEYDIERGSGVDYFEKDINVKEGVNNFIIYTYDAMDNPSVPVNAVGVSYGANYRKKLANRLIKSVIYDTDKTIINWDAIDMSLGPIQTVVEYSTLSGDTAITTPITEDKTILKGFNYQSVTFKYKTAYLPDALTIPEDTFCTKYIWRPLPVYNEVELDRSLFNAYPLPGDGVQTPWGSSIAGMWDGKTGWPNLSFIEAAFGSPPQILTIDLGVSSILSNVWIRAYAEWNGYYVKSTMKRFEIYGSVNPNLTGTLDASWILLGSYTLSGSDANPEDVNKAKEGFTWAIASNIKVRYLRVRCLENFEGNTTSASIEEIKVTGLVPQ